MRPFDCCVSDEITASFRRFGHLFVDWPHKAESKSYFPPKGEKRERNPPLDFNLHHYNNHKRLLRLSENRKSSDRY